MTAERPGGPLRPLADVRGGGQANAAEVAEALEPVVELLRTGRLDARGLAEGLLAIAEAAPARAAGGELVDARTVAAELGTDAAWVREHADELGAVRLGSGTRPRLRFDLERVRSSLAATGSGPGVPSQTPEVPAPARVRRSRRPAPSGSGAPLLPIHGQEGATSCP